VLISKIIFKNKKYYFNIFLNKYILKNNHNSNKIREITSQVKLELKRNDILNQFRINKKILTLIF
jgi:tRNA A22 N-methylase